MNNLISLPDLTEDELSLIIDEIYSNKNNKKIKNCKWICWPAQKGNMLMCDHWCINSKNYDDKKLKNIKKWMSFVFDSNIKIEEDLLKKYIVEKINKILLKKKN